MKPPPQYCLAFLVSSETVHACITGFQVPDTQAYKFNTSLISYATPQSQNVSLNDLTYSLEVRPNTTRSLDLWCPTYSPLQERWVRFSAHSSGQDLVSHLCYLSKRNTFLPRCKLGVSVSRGLEPIINSTRASTANTHDRIDMCLLKLEFSNVFNKYDCQTALHQILLHLPHLLILLGPTELPHQWGTVLWQPLHQLIIWGTTGRSPWAIALLSHP